MDHAGVGTDRLGGETRARSVGGDGRAQLVSERTMKRELEATAEAESLVRTSVAPGPKRAYLSTLRQAQRGRQAGGVGDELGSRPRSVRCARAGTISYLRFFLLLFVLIVILFILVLFLFAVVVRWVLVCAARSTVIGLVLVLLLTVLIRLGFDVRLVLLRCQ